MKQTVAHLVRIAADRYEDAEGTAGGIRLLTLEAGAHTETAITVRAKGKALKEPLLPADLPLTVRLRAAGNSCWAATFSSTGVRQNSARQLVAAPD